MVEIRDLGPLAIDEESVERLVSSPTQRQLLACLVAALPGAVSTERLLELLWPGQNSQPRRVWTHVSRLRTRLAGAGQVLVEDVGGGYRLGGDVRSDAERFEALVDRVGDPAGASRSFDQVDVAGADRLGQALGLWRGDYLEGFDADLYRPGRREQLSELRLTVALSLARFRLDREAPETVLPDLEQLAAEQPFNEAVVELIAKTMHREGRRVESLRRIQAFRDRLVEQAGLDPGPSLARLEYQILSDDHLIAADRASPPPVEMVSLPRWRTSFVGRQEAVDEVAGFVTDHRLVTLVGPAGVGKTRLAVETLSDRDPPGNGVLFVDLASAASGSEVENIVAGALGLGSQTGANTRPAILRHLRLAPPTLIFDNCEHVIEAASRLVDDIIGSCPDSRILATSRERLRVPDEVPYRVQPLNSDNRSTDVAPALQLLLDRTRMDLPSLSPDERLAAERLCHRLDGLPLAIELAAHRLFTSSIGELADDLDDRYGVLTTGDRVAPDRHRTLGAAIAWSTDALNDRQHDVLVRCSSFAGRFTSDDAAAVCCDHQISAQDVKTVLVELVERSLVDRVSGTAPYRLLDTLRRYGNDRLASNSETETWHVRHADHFAAKAVNHAADALGPNEGANTRLVLSQSSDYRRAIVFARDTERWESLADLVWGVTTSTFFMRGAWVEPAFLMEPLASTIPHPTPHRWSTVLAAVASTFHNRRDANRAQATAELAIAANPEDPQAWAQAAYAWLLTDPVRARRRAQEAVQLSDEDVATEILPSLAISALTQARSGGTDTAVETAEQLVRRARRFRSTTAECNGLWVLSECLPPGSPAAAAAAGSAVEVAESFGYPTVHEVMAATMHAKHLLSIDLDAARTVLLDNLARGALKTDVIYEHRVLGGAAAYYAVIGERDRATEIGRATGGLYVPDNSGLQEVDDLRDSLIAEGRKASDASIDTARLVDLVAADLRLRQRSR